MLAFSVTGLKKKKKTKKPETQLVVLERDENLAMGNSRAFINSGITSSGPSLTHVPCIFFLSFCLCVCVCGKIHIM